MNYKDMGARVRRSRKQMKLTQEKLAELVGISPSFMGHIERGTRVASLETLVALCNVLKVTPEYLLSASLDSQNVMPAGLNSAERAKLSEFLRLAQDAMQGWTDR